MEPKKLWKFVGRRNIYAVQTNTGYVPIRKELTEKDLQEHLKGIKTLGSYVITETGKCNFAVIDVDGDPNKLDSWKALSIKIFYIFPEFNRVLESSGRRGFHIWLFPKDPEPPAFLRELIKARFKLHNLRNIEIYPKQNKVDVLKKQLGNLIKLPCGIHKKSGKRSVILKEAKENEI